MIKLVAFDLDGTALDSRKRLDSGLKEVLDILKDRGIKALIVSGRNEELLAGYVDELECTDPYITNNGGNIYRMHQCLYSDYFPQRYNDKIAKILSENDIPFRLFSDEGYYAYRTSRFFEERMALFKLRGLHDYHPDLHLKDHHIYKITCDFHDHPAKCDEVVQKVREECPDMNFLKAEEGIYCANSLSANKGEALSRVCEMLDIKTDEVMAFGDSDNDLPMLEIASVSIAMGNATKQIREKCDHICGDNDHNGVSTFLREYFNL